MAEANATARNREQSGIMKTKIKLQLFGKFTLTNGEKILTEETLHSKKLTRMLAYILVNRDTILSHQRLIEVFWEDESKSPEGALKNLMYRLRMVMKELGKEQFICTLPGAYQWNPEIEVESDYEWFEVLAAKVRENQADDKAVEQLCEEAIECYQGNVSARIAEEPWILSKTIWYQSLFMDIVKTLCEIYKSKRKWDRLEQICNQALAVDAYDEDVHCWMLESLKGQKKYKLAVTHYERTRKLFYENMGIRVSGRMQEIYQNLMRESGGSISNIAGLIEETKEHGQPSGAYLCEYGVFRQIYRIEARRVTRLGIAEYLMLMTIQTKGFSFAEDKTGSAIGKAMDILERMICESLRAGDVVARYSPTQYIVLLPACSFESGEAVANRICRNFRKHAGRYQCNVAYELAEISAMA